MITYKQINKTWFTTGKSVRKSLEVRRLPDDSDTLPRIAAGEFMKFVNRETECVEVAEAFAHLRLNMENAKQEKTTYDAIKHHIRVVVCEGISGLGKSRLARVAMTEALKQKTTGPLQDRMKAVREMWESLDQDVEDSINIRINCRHLPSNSTIVEDFILELLFEWKKHERVKEVDSEAVAHGEFIAAYKGRPGLTLAGIFQKLSKAATVVFINLDEAQQSPGIGKVLDGYAEALLGCKGNIFVTVTGLQGNSLPTLVDQSSCTAVPVILPPLGYNYMGSILKDMFGADLDINISLVYLLKSFSGVVKYLADALDELFKSCGFKKSDVRQKLQHFTHKDASELFRSTMLAYYKSSASTDIPVEVVHNLVSFAVGGIKITPNHFSANLSNSHIKPFTFSDAQREQLCYISTKSVNCPIVLPIMHICNYYSAFNSSSSDAAPMVLPLMQLAGIKYLFCCGCVFSNNYLYSCSGFGSSRDNESLLLSVIKNREKCFTILGLTEITLSELLGVPLPSEDNHTVVLQDNPLRIATTSETITTAQEVENLKNRLFCEGKMCAGVQSTAFVNKSATASFADALLFYRTTKDKTVLTVYIQEKQSVVARLHSLKSGSLPVQHTYLSVQEELEKCKIPSDSKSLFVFASDSAPTTKSVTTPHTLMLFGGNDGLLSKALGDVAWFARSNVLASSQYELNHGAASKPIVQDTRMHISAVSVQAKSPKRGGGDNTPSGQQCSSAKKKRQRHH